MRLKGKILIVQWVDRSLTLHPIPEKHPKRFLKETREFALGCTTQWVIDANDLFTTDHGDDPEGCVYAEQVYPK